MSEEYPDDADGDSLRRVAATGADMARPMKIEFFVTAPDRETAEAIARLTARIGYLPEVIHDEEEDDAWDCRCLKTMVSTYDAVLAAQRELDEPARPLGGRGDGWGTFGEPADD